MRRLFTLLVILGLVATVNAGSYCSLGEQFCVVGRLAFLSRLRRNEKLIPCVSTVGNLADFKITAPSSASNGWVAIGMGADSMPGSEVFMVGSSERVPERACERRSRVYETDGFRRCRACEVRRKQTLRWLLASPFARKRENRPSETRGRNE
jgi:hypothetical protein